MITLLTTPGIKRMRAARLDEEQRVGKEGKEKERREKERGGTGRDFWREGGEKQEEREEQGPPSAKRKAQV